MKSEDFLLSFSIIVLVIAIVITGVIYSSVTFYKNNWLTGFTSNIAYVNVNITTVASVNFSTDTINWGTGSVLPGQTFAILDTAAGNVSNGNWTAVTHGFVLQNIGNVNVSVQLSTLYTAATLIGGYNPLYQLNVTTNGTTPSGYICSNWTGGGPESNLSIWRNISSPMMLCTNFTDNSTNVNGGNDPTMRIDVRVYVPNNAVGGGNDTWTITAAKSQAILPLYSLKGFFNYF
jgi:hypothetical protein